VRFLCHAAYTGTGASWQGRSAEVLPQIAVEQRGGQFVEACDETSSRMEIPGANPK
jgi:hypothetical protein